MKVEKSKQYIRKGYRSANKISQKIQSIILNMYYIYLPIFNVKIIQNKCNIIHYIYINLLNGKDYFLIKSKTIIFLGC